MPTIYTKLCDSVILVAASPRWALRGEQKHFPRDHGGPCAACCVILTGNDVLGLSIFAHGQLLVRISKMLRERTSTLIYESLD
jgi:hypothetical protein